MSYLLRIVLILAACGAAAQPTERPETAAEWMDAARGYYDAYAYDDAQAALDEALLLESEMIAALRLRACYAAAQGAWDHAVQRLERAESIKAIVPEFYDETPMDSGCADAQAVQHLKLGLFFDEADLHVEAIEQYTFAIARCPDYPWAYALRAAAYGFNSDTGAAMRDTEKVIGMAPEFLWPYLSRAYNVYYDYGDYDAALQDLDAVLELDSEYADACALRGDVHAALGDYTAALADYTRAIELEPANGRAYANRGYFASYTGLTDVAAAIEDLDRAIEIEPENGEYYDYRADVYQFAGRYAEALEDLSRAIEFDPDDAWSYVLRGYIRSERDDKTGALEDFNTAIDLDPWMGWAYAERGTLYLNQGRIFTAIADLRTAQDYNGFRISDPRPALIFVLICAVVVVFLAALVISVAVILFLARRNRKRRGASGPPPLPPAYTTG